MDYILPHDEPARNVRASQAGQTGKLDGSPDDPILLQNLTPAEQAIVQCLRIFARRGRALREGREK